ncbi:MAG: tetratricopeptide repeat protein [Pseudomonadota bacterium]
MANRTTAPLQTTIVKTAIKTLLLAALFGASASTVAAADSVTSKTYKKLTAAQEMMGGGDVTQAIADLKTLADEVAGDTLDAALTLQMLGYAQMANEQFPEAIKNLKASLAIDRLPEKVKYNVGYMVAQLHAAQGEFDEALAFAADWFDTLEAPTPDQLMFMANIYAQTKRYAEAIPYAERAVVAVDKPNASWYQLLTAANFELRRYKDAARTLRRMVEHWPDNSSYWEQLASVHVVQEQERTALAVLRLAWLNGVLEKESSIKSMVQLAASRGMPEHAARLLEEAFDDQLLPRNKDYVEMLASAWMAAREQDEAIAALRELAELQGTGEPMLRVANLQVERGEWGAAEAALEDALQRGLESPGKAWLLLGIARSEQERFEDAFAALRKARSFDVTRRQATRWLSYAEDMRKQAQWQARYGS